MSFIKIVLNRNLTKILDKNRSCIKDILTLLKAFIPKQRSEVLFWFINPKNPKISIQFMQKQEMASIVKNIQKIAPILNFDPLECIFGIYIQQTDSLKYQPFKLSISSTETQSKSQTSANTVHHYKQVACSPIVQNNQNRYPYKVMNNNFFEAHKINHLGNSKILQNNKQTQQKEKFENRLSLPIGQTTYIQNNNKIIFQSHKFNDHHQGIQLITPRPKQTQKIMLSINQTKHDKMQINTERISFQRGKQANINKVKTIQLGRGRGCETERERRER